MVILGLAGACTSDGGEGPAGPEGDATVDAGRFPDGTPPGTYPSVPMAELDQRLVERVAAAPLDGAVLLVEQDGARLHTFVTGAVTTATPRPLAETGMWPAAATLMTLVDEGAVALDEPVSRVLPWMAGRDKAGITLRHLLSQTSGLPRTIDCDAPEACDTAIAAAPLLTPPGEGFALSPVGYHVAARLAEAVTGEPWERLTRTRLFDRLGMADTAFFPPPPPAPRSTPAPPSTTAEDLPAPGLVAARGTTTADDLGRFLTMILARGATPDGPVLTVAAVEEMERNQTRLLSTDSEPWVAATGIPTYGLGVWRDRLRGDGTALASMVSAPNRVGVYPLVDRTRNAWAVIAVDDDPVAPFQAVRESAALAQLMAVAIDTDGRPVVRPGTPLGR